MPLAGLGLCDDSTSVSVRLPSCVYVGCYVEGQGDADNDGDHDRWPWIHADIGPQDSDAPLMSFNGSAGSGVCDDSTGAGVRLPWRVCVGCNVE